MKNMYHRILAALADRRPHRQASGQAVVELALSATFLALLFAAAIDLGLAFKSYQTLINATAEASSYLTINPSTSCGTCTPADAMATADREARVRFRAEQGDQIRGFGGSTMDLNADGKDDAVTVPAGHGTFESFIRAKVQIGEADSSQIDIDTGGFVGGTFTETTDERCQQRMSQDINGGQCFIVVRSEITYNTFALSPIIGSTMTLRAVSVKPILP